MKKIDVLVLGGSAGGLTAAISASRNYPDKDITLVRREEKVLVPCGIPYIFGTLGSVEKNLIPADEMLSANKIESIIDEVTEIDRAKKVVKTAKGEEIGYEKLILATGSLPIIPSIPGVDLENVFVAKKDVEYLTGMLKTIEASKRVVIIGGGFIGMEFADDLTKRGLDITVVEMLPHCLQLNFDDEFCDKVEERLKEKGVKLLTDTTAEEIGGEKGKGVEYVKLKGGEKLDADVVILGIGTRSNTEIGEKAGLKIGDSHAIWVDDFQRTSDPDIFAVGDCAEKRFFLTGTPAPLLLSSIAGMEAKIAGANLFGLRYKNDGAAGAFATIMGDTAFGAVGLTERSAKEAGIGYVKGEFTTTDKHPGTLPDTKESHLKLLFTKSGEIIGGEVYGGIATGELTNIIATLIEKKMRIDELVTLQIATHPWLTASPIGYLISNAAEMAIGELI